MKKPKKSDSDNYNYKGFFSLLLLTQVDRFLWVDVGSSESSSDPQIFNRSKLKKKIKDGTSGLPAPKPLGEGGQDLHYFVLGGYTFALVPCLVKHYSRKTVHKGRENS